MVYSNIVTEYYYIVYESLFNDYKDSDSIGICIYIDLVGCLSRIFYSTFSNNIYKDGAIYATNSDLIEQKFVCYYNNEGYRGSHFCFDIGSHLCNYTSEKSDHECHGSMSSGYHNNHFSFNNISNSNIIMHSPWHYYSSRLSSNIKFCQESNITSESISTCNMQNTAINLENFNFIDCRAKMLNNMLGSGGTINYIGCIFLLNCNVTIGTACTFTSCYSDGSIPDKTITNTNNIIGIKFLNQLLCLKRIRYENTPAIAMKMICYITLHFLVFPKTNSGYGTAKARARE